MIRASLKVNGMTCNHCVETITKSLEKLSGVLAVIVDLDKKSVKLDYDENIIKLEKITDKIIDLGFEIGEE
tara:strand:+ start:2090 stop:2302 length:213 start_codon:yes stop_codon:yes gene_type:complete